MPTDQTYSSAARLLRPTSKLGPLFGVTRKDIDTAAREMDLGIRDEMNARRATRLRVVATGILGGLVALLALAGVVVTSTPVHAEEPAGDPTPFVLLVWSYPNADDPWDGDQILVNHVDLTEGSLAALDEWIAAQCGNFQVDLENDSPTTRALMDVGKLFNPGDPVEDHAYGAVTGDPWKYAVGTACAPEPSPEPSVDPTPQPSIDPSPQASIEPSPIAQAPPPVAAVPALKALPAAPIDVLAETGLEPWQVIGSIGLGLALIASGYGLVVAAGGRRS